MSEEKQPIESPQLEEKEGAAPEKAPVKTEETSVDIDALMQTLEAANVKSTEQLKGRLTNAREYDKAQSERDKLAQELAQMRYEMAELKTKPAARPTDDFDDYEPGKSVDLEDVMTRVYRKERERELRQAAEQNKRVSEVWSSITGDENYHLVREKFEESLRDPVTSMKIQSGQVDVQKFYNKMVVDHFKDLTSQTVAAFKQMKGSNPVKPPHVESSARVSDAGNLSHEDEAQQKKIAELRKKSKGHLGLRDDEKDGLIDGTLADFLIR